MAGMRMKAFLFMPLVAAFVTFAAASEPPAARSAAAQLAVTGEREMAELLPRGGWDGEAVGTMSSRLASLPDMAAAELLWQAAAAPAGVDATPILEAGTRSFSPRVRRVALSILISLDGPAAEKAWLDALARERDGEVVRAVVEGLSNLPGERAVRGLVEAAALPGADARLLSETSGALRRLTGVHLSDDPAAWRRWWRDSRQK